MMAILPTAYYNSLSLGQKQGDESLMYEQLRKVQLVELDILKKVIALCEKHNIEYFAAWGTLLGAVRHKGFIPWDDDVDLMMPRPEYERFCEIARQELEYPYFLQINKTDPLYNLHFAKVQNLETAFVGTHKPRSLKAGIFIDVFPIDAAPNTKQQKIIKQKYRLYKYCAYDFFNYEPSFGDVFKRSIGKMINYTIFGNKPPRFFFDKQEMLYKSCKYAEADIVIDYSEKFYFAKQLLNERIYIDFEDTQLCCPAKYDILLTMLYGDYMTPPPIEKRAVHHDIFALSTEKSYMEFIKER
ncbi:MAG: LicD family protein [Synergistaceae bacterium]|nr:LicD family protein [Candidatus Equadaptatus faecalis]